MHPTWCISSYRDERLSRMGLMCRWSLFESRKCEKVYEHREDAQSFSDGCAAKVLLSLIFLRDCPILKYKVVEAGLENPRFVSSLHHFPVPEAENTVENALCRLMTMEQPIFPFLSYPLDCISISECDCSLAAHFSITEIRKRRSEPSIFSHVNFMSFWLSVRQILCRFAWIVKLWQLTVKLHYPSLLCLKSFSNTRQERLGGGHNPRMSE